MRLDVACRDALGFGGRVRNSAMKKKIEKRLKKRRHSGKRFVLR
jgi:hypothetical protein